MKKKPLTPLVKNGGFIASKDYTPLVYPGGFTTLQNKEKNSIAEDNKKRQDNEGANP